MSENDQSKTEAATEYKLEQARKKGMVPRSAELGAIAALVSALGYLGLAGGELFVELMHACERVLSATGSFEGDGAMAYWLGRVGHAGLRLVAPLLMVVAAAVVLVLLAQNGIVVAPAAMRPDWSRLNPATGVKRLFSLQTLLDTGKTLLKLTAYSLVCVWVLDGLVRTWAQADLAAGALARAGSVACLQLLLALLGVTAVFAALDQLLARKMFARQMRMSPHEIKQEFKQREGDPRIKQRREQLQRELLQRAASARGVRGADVVITNPTHYLVGLKYERGRMAAPKVVARGQGNVALRLRAIAFRHGVPIVASPLLARQLFRGVRQDDEIPPALFSQVVAVYLKLRLPPR